MSDLDAFQTRLGYQFQQPELLRLALTHSSISHAAGRPAPNNQRLEFLGDAVLQLVLTRELYDRFPDLDEGALTKSRAQLVNRRALAEQARRMGLGSGIILSRAEEANRGRERPSILANTYESVIGALFLDGGYEAARVFVLGQFSGEFSHLKPAPQLLNPKGELQELLQATETNPPQYKMLAASGPAHDRAFECAVFNGGEEIGRGRGTSKKTAESAAAEAALIVLRARQAAAAATAATATPVAESPTAEAGATG